MTDKRWSLRRALFIVPRALFIVSPIRRSALCIVLRPSLLLHRVGVYLDACAGNFGFDGAQHTDGEVVCFL